MNAKRPSQPDAEGMDERAYMGQLLRRVLYAAGRIDPMTATPEEVRRAAWDYAEDLLGNEEGR